MDTDGEVEGVGQVDGLHHGLRYAVPDVEQGDRMVKSQIPGRGRGRIKLVDDVFQMMSCDSLDHTLKMYRILKTQKK